MGRNFLFFLAAALVLTSCARPKQEPLGREFRKSSPQKDIVVLDPGHGGKAHGTQMVIAPFTKEKALALQTALRVRDLLEQWGYNVKLTRTKDVDLPLEKRVALARQFKGTLFVSLHYNHAPNKEAKGVEVFYYGKGKFIKSSKLLAHDILKSITSHTKAHSRGVHAGDFHVLRENSMPAVLVEGGFFSNAQEAKKLSTPKYLNTLAYSIAKGIDTYLSH